MYVHRRQARLVDGRLTRGLANKMPRTFRVCGAFLQLAPVVDVDRQDTIGISNGRRLVSE
jgi:hypothetical protein